VDQPLHPATVKLFESLIRLGKGAITAMEDWLKIRRSS
jgi:hypothetical protein